MVDWPTTILLVDDEEIVRLVASKMLGDDKTVLIASNGREAIAIFEKRVDEIDCVLLDVVMPGFSGIQTFHELRKIKGDIPVLFMSGYCKEDAVKDLVSGGRCGFINKPYRRRVLNAELENLLVDEDQNT